MPISRSSAPTPTHTQSTSAGQTFDSCVVFMLGYPGMGKRTVGGHVAQQLDGVLVHNALINQPLLELFRWDGVQPLPPQIWDYAIPIRDAVLRTIEDLAPPTNNYVFTNVLEDDEGAAEEYARVRALAQRRRSLFLAVMLTCDLEEQVSRIDTPDRIAWRKGADPEGYRRYTLTTDLFQPPADEVFHVDTSHVAPAENARHIVDELWRRGFTGKSATSST